MKKIWLWTKPWRHRQWYRLRPRFIPTWNRWKLNFERMMLLLPPHGSISEKGILKIAPGDVIRITGSCTISRHLAGDWTQREHDVSTAIPGEVGTNNYKEGLVIVAGRWGCSLELKFPTPASKKASADVTHATSAEKITKQAA